MTRTPAESALVAQIVRELRKRARACDRAAREVTDATLAAFEASRREAYDDAADYVERRYGARRKGE